MRVSCGWELRSRLGIFRRDARDDTRRTHWGESNVNVRTSVVIPCLQAGATLDLQLEALAAQKDALPFEVVIADNGSTDNTRQVVARWANVLDR